MSYDHIYEYLEDKIIRVNVNNPKANWGARLLSQHMDMEDLDDYILDFIDNVQTYFRKNETEKDPAGQANLSVVCMSTGKRILTDCGLKGEGKLWIADQIRTGDLFVEAFVRHGYIEIERSFRESDEGEKVDAGYILKITDRWVEMFKTTKRDRTRLLYTKDTPFTGGCLIKGDLRKTMQDRPWRRSASQLMETPWKINARVLEAVIANESMFVSHVKLGDTLLEQQRKSKLSDYYVITAKAKGLVGDTFYQEVEADYRGRIYYKEPFMNFQGSDLARGVLLFGEAKAMTEEGKWWLAVHTAASYNQSYDIDKIPSWVETDYKSYLEEQDLDSISVDKFTLEDRVRWTNENMETILEAGRLRLFVEGAEKGISFLSCCVEWHDILMAELRDDVHYTRLPIGIDGSNNGWQHLGAISKDVRTGELVGLVANEIQRDFYVSTAKQLLEIDDPKLNAMPMKDIRKCISKRGSMTRAYSAGAKKIGENMWMDCRTSKFDQKYDITKEDCKKWAKSLIKAIDDVCAGPLETMKYMQDLASHHIGTYARYKDDEDCTKEYSKIRKQLDKIWKRKRKDWTDDDRILYEALRLKLNDYESVLIKGNGARHISWVSPSGFPVRYEAFREDNFQCKGTINGERISHKLVIYMDTPDLHKFMCGISPNYVHSQDAAHMAMVIDDWKGTFGAIHDSFSTHACDVDDLLELTKDVFVNMYNTKNYFDIIQKNITGGTDNIKQPTLGTLDVQEVYDSDYFFA